jgi:hypothetical protein
LSQRWCEFCGADIRSDGSCMCETDESAQDPVTQGYLQQRRAIFEEMK